MISIIILGHTFLVEKVMVSAAADQAFPRLPALLRIVTPQAGPAPPLLGNEFLALGRREGKEGWTFVEVVGLRALRADRDSGGGCMVGRGFPLLCCGGGLS